MNMNRFRTKILFFIIFNPIINFKKPMKSFNSIDMYLDAKFPRLMHFQIQND